MDMGAAMHATLVVVGDKLGLYKAMADGNWLTSAKLAARTTTAERYVREWLNANAASGYVKYDPDTQRYQLPPEQAFALTVQDLPGAFHIISSCFKDEPKITQAFRTGEGGGWHEHDANLFFGTERFFRPNYENNLLSSWLPALDGACSVRDFGVDENGRSCCADPSGLRAILWHGRFRAQAGQATDSRSGLIHWSCGSMAESIGSFKRTGAHAYGCRHAVGGVGPECRNLSGVITPSRLKTSPSFITDLTSRSVSMFSSGFSRTAIRSAGIPTLMGPLLS